MRERTDITDTTEKPNPKRRGKGFEQAAGLLASRLRAVGEARGFAVTRLLTHWPEIAGEDIAQMGQPVKVSYAREGGLGATLTLLCSGAVAPMVQMRLPQLRDRVNACYGYNAISRIRITQTSPQGFAETQTAFAHATSQPETPPPSAAVSAAVSETTAPVADERLRAALALLGSNILTRQEKKENRR